MKSESFFVTVAITVSVLGSCGVASAAARRDTGLLEAARARDVVRVRALLNGASDVNATDPDGASALHWAAHWDDVTMADLLLRTGARINQANEFGATPLWLACVNGSSDMVK